MKKKIGQRITIMLCKSIDEQNIQHELVVGSESTRNVAEERKMGQAEVMLLVSGCC